MDRGKKEQEIQKTRQERKAARQRATVGPVKSLKRGKEGEASALALALSYRTLSPSGHEKRSAYLG